MIKLKHPETERVLFSHEELKCRHCDGAVLAHGFENALIALRVAFNNPMTVTSCCRCEAHNSNVGGHPKSLHVYDFPAHPTAGTAAIDIAGAIGARALRLISLAYQQGWSVGLNFSRNFIHLDRRNDFGIGASTLFRY